MKTMAYSLHLKSKYDIYEYKFKLPSCRIFYILATGNNCGICTIFVNDQTVNTIKYGSLSYKSSRFQRNGEQYVQGNSHIFCRIIKTFIIMSVKLGLSNICKKCSSLKTMQNNIKIITDFELL